MKFGIRKRIQVAIIENDHPFRRLACDQIMLHPVVIAVQEFHSAEDFLKSSDKENFDMLFLDVQLPGMSGLDLLPLLKQKVENLKTVIITHLSTDDTILKAIQKGAVGYLWKSEIGSIDSTIEITLNGGASISPTIALKMLNIFKENPSVKSPLTKRETQVMEILVSGLSCEKAADMLDLSVNTVRKHVRNIYEKLHVNNRIGLLQQARELGIG